MKLNRTAVWIVAGAFGAAAAIVLVVRFQHWRPRSITIQGAVIQRDADTRRQIPIANAVVAVSDGIAHAATLSSASGYFKVTFRERILPGETVRLDFSAPHFHPLDMEIQTGIRSDLKKLVVAAMQPVAAPSAMAVGRQSVVSGILIRYTVNYRTDADIGSAVKTFQVVNIGNVPCEHFPLCSPDGRWKASKNSMTMDAGTGNIFRNVRTSCIAGPCPFTQIDPRGFAHGGRIVVASAIDWSDTATFLVEAEVFQQSIASDVRESYPVIYGRDLHFTLPPTAEGPSIEADIGGAPIVFPLGSGLYMNWARCNSRTSTKNENSTVYQCALKSGYRF
ncbi:MAG: hypothetical protein ACRD27_03610 [Terracidiphilus sp.]